METLVVYDSVGYIINQCTGLREDMREPIGIPFMWVTVPDGKYLTGVDVSVTPNVPIYEDVPPSEITLMEERVELLESCINDLILMAMGV